MSDGVLSRENLDPQPLQALDLVSPLSFPSRSALLADRKRVTGAIGRSRGQRRLRANVKKRLQRDSIMTHCLWRYTQLLLVTPRGLRSFVAEGPSGRCPTPMARPRLPCPDAAPRAAAISGARTRLPLALAVAVCSPRRPKTCGPRNRSIERSTSLARQCQRKPQRDSFITHCLWRYTQLRRTLMSGARQRKRL